MPDPASQLNFAITHSTSALCLSLITSQHHVIRYKCSIWCISWGFKAEPEVHPGFLLLLHCFHIPDRAGHRGTYSSMSIHRPPIKDNSSDGCIPPMLFCMIHPSCFLPKLSLHISCINPEHVMQAAQHVQVSIATGLPKPSVSPTLQVATNRC